MYSLFLPPCCAVGFPVVSPTVVPYHPQITVIAVRIPFFGHALPHLGSRTVDDIEKLLTSAFANPSCYRRMPPLLPLRTHANEKKQWVWNNRQFRPVSAPPAPKTMKNEAELTELLASTDPDSLVVVKFHAILCGASKAIEGKFKQTAAEFADLHLDGQQSVTFADVCFDSNRQLCERMGIKSVPHVQVSSSSCSRCHSFFSRGQGGRLRANDEKSVVVSCRFAPHVLEIARSSRDLRYTS